MRGGHVDGRGRGKVIGKAQMTECGAEMYRHDGGVARECDVETEERLWGRRSGDNPPGGGEREYEGRTHGRRW
jgi:hypothetical protein